MIGKMLSMTLLRRSHKRQSVKTFQLQRIITKSSHRKRKRKLLSRLRKRKEARKRRPLSRKRARLHQRLLSI